MDDAEVTREITAFRDALIAAAEAVMPERYDTGGLVEWDIADAVLAMPEMQAIRQVLHRLGVRHAAGVDARWTLLWNELPESVKRWAQ